MEIDWEAVKELCVRKTDAFRCVLEGLIAQRAPRAIVAAEVYSPETTAEFGGRRRAFILVRTWFPYTEAHVGRRRHMTHDSEPCRLPTPTEEELSCMANLVGEAAAAVGFQAFRATRRKIDHIFAETEGMWWFRVGPAQLPVKKE